MCVCVCACVCVSVPVCVCLCLLSVLRAIHMGLCKENTCVVSGMKCVVLDNCTCCTCMVAW